MRIKVAFRLPRNAQSVGVARQALDRVFAAFGVRSDCRDEIALAVSEACSNVVQHADGEMAYDLAAESDESRCVITIDDTGPGLTQDGPTDEMPAVHATSGRGMAIMKVTTDRIELNRRPGGGMSVRLFKTLRWQEGALGLAP